MIHYIKTFFCVFLFFLSFIPFQANCTNVPGEVLGPTGIVKALILGQAILPQTVSTASTSQILFLSPESGTNQPGDVVVINGTFTSTANVHLQIYKDIGGTQCVLFGGCETTNYCSPVYTDATTFTCKWTPFNFPGTGETYYWRVSGDNGLVSSMRSFVNGPMGLPTKPVLISPLQNAIQDSPVKVKWKNDSNSGASGWTIQIAKDSNFSNPVVKNANDGSCEYGGSWPDNSYVECDVTSSLQLNTNTFYWRVAGYDSNINYGQFSDVRSFHRPFSNLTISASPSSIPENPSNNEVINLSGSVVSNVSKTWELLVNGQYFQGGPISGNSGGSPIEFKADFNVAWNGRGANGALLPPGIYTVVLNAKSISGTILASKSLNVQVLGAVGFDPKTAEFQNMLNPKVELENMERRKVCLQSSGDIVSGNLSHNQVLFSANGHGITPSVFLTYNSNSSFNGPLGRGWAHNLDIYLENVGNTTIRVHEGAFGQLFTLKNGVAFPTAVGWYHGISANKQYESSDGTESILKGPEGSYLSRSDGRDFIFNPAGKLVKIIDKYGNEVNVSYGEGSFSPPGFASNGYLTDEQTFTFPSERIIKIQTDKISKKIVAIIDPSGKYHMFSYHPKQSGQSYLLKNVTYLIDNQKYGAWNYIYNTLNLLEFKIDPEGHTSRYEYSNDGRLRFSFDPEAFDRPGLAVVNPDGHVRSFDYYDGKTIFTEKDGGVWTYTYNQTSGLIESVENPLGSITRYFYYQDGKLKEKISQIDTDVFYVDRNESYDFYGNITEKKGYHRKEIYDQSLKTFNVVGEEILDKHVKYEYYYDITFNGLASGANEFPWRSSFEIKSITDFMPNVSNIITYNYSNYVTTVTDSEGLKNEVGYYGNGLLQYTKNSNGIVKTYYYHSNGDLNYVQDIGKKIELSDYNNNGFPNTLKVWQDNLLLVRTEKFTYDYLNNVINHTVVQGGVKNGSPIDLVTTYGYDKVGNRTSMQDAEHAGLPDKATLFAYDFKGNMTKVTDILGFTTEFNFGREGCPSCGSGVDQVTSVKNANMGETTFDYFKNGALERETHPNSHPIVYSYLAGGAVDTKTDESTGQVLIDYGYYDDGSLKNKVYPLEGKSIEFTYWPEGYVKSASTADVVYSYEYYANGSLKKVTDSRGMVLNYSLEIVDGIIKKKTVTVEGSMVGTPQTVIYENDPNGRLWKIWSAADYLARPFTIGYESFSRGLRQRMSYPNGNSVSYGYHSKMDWLTFVSNRFADNITISPGDRRTRDYRLPVYIIVDYPEFDLVGNRKKRIQKGVVTNFSYDDLYRLTSAVTLGGSNENFTYDAVGNRKTGPTATDGDMGPNAVNSGNQLRMGSTFDYEYDDYGNLKSKSAGGSINDEFTWNAENQLIMVKNHLANRIVKFKYDPFGRRIQKMVTEGGGISATVRTTNYYYNGEDIIFETLDVINNGLAQPRVSTYYVHGTGVDEPLAMVRDGKKYYFHADGLGSVVAISDGAGKLLETYNYDSFGTPTSSGTGILIPYAFTGREWDKEIGLYYYRARYYDPMVGRFISRDPIGFAGGDVNLYGYVLNNPVNFIDPFGLLNPAKTTIGLINSVRGIQGVVKGVGTIMVGNVAMPFTGGVSGPAANIIGVGQIALGLGNLSRGMKQASEAYSEDWDEASWKNLLGLAPFGQKFDDACEPGPWEYFSGVKDKAITDPYNAGKEAIKDFFAID